MKKQLMRVVNANYFSKFIKTSVVVLLLTGATAANGQATPASFSIDEPRKTDVTYVTTTHESLMFDVKVANADGEKFVIVVKDENGTTLYRGSFSGKEFKKRFVLPKTDASKITFHVKSDSGSSSESFEINTNTRVVEEVVVKKVI